MNKITIVYRFFLACLCFYCSFANATVKNQDGNLAFTHLGYYMLYQYGGVYSKQYGREITQYDEQDLLPVIGVDTTGRFSLGYNYTHNIGFEASLLDSGVQLDHRRNDYTDKGITQQNYDFNIYNLEFTTVFKNGFQDSNTNIYSKLGFAYTHGEFNISYVTTESIGPSWNKLGKQYHKSFTADAIVPIFDVGMAWSANRYLAFTADYERVFKPVVTLSHFNDPLNSNLQVLNMFLIGAYYAF